MINLPNIIFLSFTGEHKHQQLTILHKIVLRMGLNQDEEASNEYMISTTYGFSFSYYF